MLTDPDVISEHALREERAPSVPSIPITDTVVLFPFAYNPTLKAISIGYLLYVNGKLKYLLIKHASCNHCFLITIQRTQTNVG